MFLKSVVLGVQKEVFLQSKSPLGVFLRGIRCDRHPVPFESFKLLIVVVMGCDALQ